MKMAATVWFAFRGQELLVRIEGRTAALPSPEDWAALGLSAAEPHLVGELRGSAAYAVGLDPEMPLPEGMELLGLRNLARGAPVQLLVGLDGPAAIHRP